MSLSGKVIAISGTLSQPRATITSLITSNGGTFSTSYSKKVTHLMVADPTASTSKLTKARANGTEIVDEAWLSQFVADESGLEENAATQQSTLDGCRKPHDGSSLSLSGMVICLTGRLSKKKDDYAQLIAANGGTFSNTVTKKVTHVVAKDPDAASSKLDKARRYGAKIVGEDFLSGLDAVAPQSVYNTNTLCEGETITVQGNTTEYDVKKSGGVVYCTCLGWRNQSVPVNKRRCKHLNQLFGAADRVTNVLPADETKAKAPPKVLLAKKFEAEKHNPVGWWVSEKLDGVRAWWDGEKFWSRLGNMFYAPEWFRAAMPPDHILDGELFMGKKKFQQTISIVRSQDESDRWKAITFMVFDIPSHGKKPFESRMEILKEVCAGRPYTKFVEQRLVTEEDNIDQLLAEIEEVDGEGLMLRQPKSKYTGTRSNSLLKVKSFKDDEAKVIGYATEGRGRLKGMTGSLAVINRDGKKFKVGSGLTDELRRTPPAIGSLITYRYQELTNAGKPRFPTYVGLSIDKEFP